jgi:hypothetical protein
MVDQRRGIDIAESFYEVGPYFSSLVFGQILVAESQLDTGFEGFAEGAYAVTCEKKNSYGFCLAYICVVTRGCCASLPS